MQPTRQPWPRTIGLLIAGDPAARPLLAQQLRHHRKLGERWTAHAVRDYVIFLCGRAPRPGARRLRCGIPGCLCPDCLPDWGDLG